MSSHPKFLFSLGNEWYVLREWHGLKFGQHSSPVWGSPLSCTQVRKCTFSTYKSTYVGFEGRFTPPEMPFVTFLLDKSRDLKISLTDYLEVTWPSLVVIRRPNKDDHYRSFRQPRPLRCMQCLFSKVCAKYFLVVLFIFTYSQRQVGTGKWSETPLFKNEI